MRSDSGMDLVRRLQRGDAFAFEELVERYGLKVRRFVAKLSGPAHADDLTQDVFFRVYRNVRNYRDTGSFDAWLFTIANNICIDHLRRRRRGPERSIENLGADLSARMPGPQTTAELSEMSDALRRAVDRLPFEQKQVFVLREESGMSFNEVAHVVGAPLGTVLARMKYAMDKLREVLRVTV